MRALRALTIANVRSFVRDRAALFWTLAFPLIFIFLFGFIFEGSGGAGLDVAWADEDATPASAQLRAGFAAIEGVDVTDQDRAAGIASMQDGKVFDYIGRKTPTSGQELSYLTYVFKVFGTK